MQIIIAELRQNAPGRPPALPDETRIALAKADDRANRRHGRAGGGACEGGHKRPVYSIDAATDRRHDYPSVGAAAKAVGVSDSAISLAVSRRRRTAGRWWHFSERQG